MSTTNELIQSKIKMLDQDLFRAQKLAVKMLVGKDCIILKGRPYVGRKAHIELVTVNWHWDGPRVEALTRIYSLRPAITGTFLNYPAEARFFRPIKDLEILD